MSDNLFRAAPGATVNISVSSSSQRVKITRQEGRCQVSVTNAGTATAWIDFGDSTITASATTSVPILAGQTRGFTAPMPYNDSLYVAAIAAGSTGSIYFTPGVGL